MAKKRKDGRYQKQVTIGIKPDGKPKIKTIYGKTQKELDKNYRDFMAVYDKGIVLDENNITVPELAWDWYRIKKRPKLKIDPEIGTSGTDITYQAQLRAIDRHFANIKVKDITEYTIESILNSIIEDGHPAKANDIKKMLSKILDYAVSLNILLINPCDRIEAASFKRRQGRALTDIEKKRIENADLKIMDKAWLFLLRYTGIRVGESLVLGKSDINFEMRTIKINKTILNKKGGPVVQYDHTKTESGDRFVPILDGLYETLKLYVDSLPPEQEFLFLNRNGRLLLPNSLTQIFERWQKEIHLDVQPGLRFHIFRHNFITECYYAGLPLQQTMLIVGHADSRVTIEIYTHLQKLKYEDTKVLNAFYSKEKSSQNPVKEQIQEVLKVSESAKTKGFIHLVG